MKTIWSNVLLAFVLITNLAYAKAPVEKHRSPNREVDERQQQQDQSTPPGYLTRKERKELHQDVNDISKDIYRETPNAEKRSRNQNQ